MSFLCQTVLHYCSHLLIVVQWDKLDVTNFASISYRGYMVVHMHDKHSTMTDLEFSTFVECLYAVTIVVIPQLQSTILGASHQPEHMRGKNLKYHNTQCTSQSLNLLPDLSISIALIPSIAVWPLRPFFSSLLNSNAALPVKISHTLTICMVKNYNMAMIILDLKNITVDYMYVWCAWCQAHPSFTGWYDLIEAVGVSDGGQWVGVALYNVHPDAGRNDLLQQWQLLRSHGNTLVDRIVEEGCMDTGKWIKCKSCQLLIPRLPNLSQCMCNDDGRGSENVMKIQELHNMKCDSKSMQ